MTERGSEPVGENVSVEVEAHRYVDAQYESIPVPDGAPGTLEDDVGPEIYQELLTAFLSHLSLQRIELRSAATDGDIAAAQYVAHQIKGTATNFGAVRLDALANRVMQMDQSQRELLVSLVGEIDEEICVLQAGVNVEVGRQ